MPISLQEHDLAVSTHGKPHNPHSFVLDAFLDDGMNAV